jgi:uncharacterized alpha-E superfamily protein
VDYAHQFHGTTDATLNRGEGWNFLQIGKYLERADNVSRILDLKYHILLPSGEERGRQCGYGAMAGGAEIVQRFRGVPKMHTGQVTPGKVVEFILLHDSFPRSIRFCVDHLDAALHRISGCVRAQFSNDAERQSGKLCSDLNYISVGEVIKIGLHQYLDGIQQRLIEISHG